METKTTPQLVKTIDGRSVTGIASVFGVLDLGGDIVVKGAFKKTIKEQKGHIRHLWQHDFFEPPIATIKSLREVGKEDLPGEILKEVPNATGGLEIERSYLETSRGSEILEGIKEGAINEMSFGFDIIRQEIEVDEEADTRIRYLKEVKLWDTSDVNWGMNPFTVGSSKAIIFRKADLAEKEHEWEDLELANFANDGNWDDLSPAMKSFISDHFAFSMNEKPGCFEDLKFAHHLPGKRGVIGEVVLSGLKKSIRELMAGSMNISQEEIKSVYSHLEKHLREFGEDVISFKNLLLVRSLMRVNEEDLGGWGGVVVNEKAIAQLVKEFQNIFCAEPPKMGALTQNILNELALKKAKINLLISENGGL